MDHHLPTPACEKIRLECADLSWNKCMCSNLCHSKTNPGERRQGRLTTWVSGLSRTCRGQGDYSSGAWWPAESLQITAPNQVNRSCLHGGKGDHPSTGTTLPILHPPPTHHLSWDFLMATIYSYQMGSLSVPLMWNRHWSRADPALQPRSKVTVHLADAERTLCKIGPERCCLFQNADLLFYLVYLWLHTIMNTIPQHLSQRRVFTLKLAECRSVPIWCNTCMADDQRAQDASTIFGYTGMEA